MKLLITGGCGFIGSNLIHHIYQKYPNYIIWNLDALTYAGNLENLSEIQQKEALLPPREKRYHFVHGNICDPVLLENLLSSHQFDAILNLAAESHVDRSIMGAGDFIKTNIQGVHTLLDAARKHKIQRFIQMSTDEVYGDRHGATSPAAEHDTLRPSSPYSASKAAADLLIQSYIRTFKFPAIIVRPSNNFGAYQYPEKLIPLTITNLLQEIKVPVHGDGLQERSWLFTKDCCNALDVILHQGHEHEIYNIGGTQKKIIEIIEHIAGILDKDHNEFIEYVSDRPGQDKKYELHDHKLRTRHNWSNEYTFDDAIKIVVQWYIDNPSWWQGIRNNDLFRQHYVKQAMGKWF